MLTHLILEAGAVRAKNTTNILIKNLLDSCMRQWISTSYEELSLSGIAVIGYWALGWAFAYGSSSNSTVGLFIGHSQFFLAGATDYPKYKFPTLNY